jgi:hypothetical protein
MTHHLFKKIPQRDRRARDWLLHEAQAGFALTYAEMFTLSGRYAEALAELGLKPGDRVAAGGKIGRGASCFIAADPRRAISIPLDTAYTSAELDFFSAARRRNSFSAIQQGATAWRRSWLGVVWGGAVAMSRVFAGSMQGSRSKFLGCQPRAGRSRRDPSYVGDHRPLERRDADPRKSRIGRGDACRRPAFLAGRCASSRASDLSHARAFRGGQHGALAAEKSSSCRNSIRANAFGMRTTGNPSRGRRSGPDARPGEKSVQEVLAAKLAKFKLPKTRDLR